jgi:hypothetical protein
MYHVGYPSSLPRHDAQLLQIHKVWAAKSSFWLSGMIWRFVRDTEKSWTHVYPNSLQNPLKCAFHQCSWLRLDGDKIQPSTYPQTKMASCLLNPNPLSKWKLNYTAPQRRNFVQRNNFKVMFQLQDTRFWSLNPKPMLQGYQIMPSIPRYVTELQTNTTDL